MEAKIKCLIVDDDPIGRGMMEGYVHRTPNLELVASCENAFEAMDVLQRQNVDVLLSDIEMPKLNGVELAKSLPHPPVIIFITAYNNYAADSYDLNVVDYLLKPVSYERFLKAVNKAAAQIEAAQKPAIMPAVVTTDNEYIFFKTDTKKFVKVAISEITYIESVKDYLKIHTLSSGVKPVVVRSSMTAVEQKLPAAQFFRIHKSYIIALRHIKTVWASTVEMPNCDTLLPIAKDRKEKLYSLLKIEGSS